MTFYLIHVLLNLSTDMEEPKYLSSKEGVITTKFNYIRVSEAVAKTKIVQNGEKTTLVGCFFSDMPVFDEDGYCPPKDCVYDGVIRDEVDKILKWLGEQDHWEFDLPCPYDEGWCLERVYIFPDGWNTARPLTKSDIRRYKAYWIEAPLKRKTPDS